MTPRSLIGASGNLDRGHRFVHISFVIFLVGPLKGRNRWQLADSQYLVRSGSTLYSVSYSVSELDSSQRHGFSYSHGNKEEAGFIQGLGFSVR